jgi:hypothetical protein
MPTTEYSIDELPTITDAEIQGEREYWDEQARIADAAEASIARMDAEIEARESDPVSENGPGSGMMDPFECGEYYSGPAQAYDPWPDEILKDAAFLEYCEAQDEAAELRWAAMSPEKRATEARKLAMVARAYEEALRVGR